jgi:hypothetical protein
MLQSERQTVRLADGKGALSHAQSQRILEQLKARSPVFERRGCVAQR